jgi:hypothetical protein
MHKLAELPAIDDASRRGEVSNPKTRQPAVCADRFRGGARDAPCVHR